MADFHQPRTVTTIHRLNAGSASQMERTLGQWGRKRPVGLVLPALYCEFEHPAMARIARELASARFLKRVVVVLGQADAAQYKRARTFFDRFDVPVSFLLVDHPRVDGYLAGLGRLGLGTGQAGKGRTCWLGAGYLLAQGDCDVIAFHDCDIRNYSRDIVARLCAPLAHPELEFEFAKGYYARVNGQLFGRVTRLFVTPLVQALRESGHNSPFLDFVGDLRYPLSGEMAMRADLMRSMPTAADWGLEIGTLAEVHRRVPASRVCQVEVSETYEHKHKPLSADNADQGLHRMAVEVGAALIRAVSQEERVAASLFVDALTTCYRQIAGQLVTRYRADASLNALSFDEEAEQHAVSVFAGAIPAAARRAHEPAAASLPAWRDVEAVFPRALDRLRDLVDELDVRRPVPVRARVARLLSRRARPSWSQTPPLPAEDFA
jgi:glucosyl-3-phosphoglycerate synthase